MGQATSAALEKESSGSDRFSIASSSGFPLIDDFSDEITAHRDSTAAIPDECLAYVFQFLGHADRKCCSLVSKRWLRVDGENRRRLSLNAQSEIVTSLPSLFTRFDSVTKLSLHCGRKFVSLDDDALVTISIQFRNLSQLKLRGCRQITDAGMFGFAQNSKKLRKLTCASCMFGAKALNAVLDYCMNLEELSVKRLRGIHDGCDPIGPGAAASSLKMICLKELVNGQSFEPLVVNSKNLRALKIIHCLGNWDRVLKLLGNQNKNELYNLNANGNSSGSSLMDVHLERLQMSDIGLSAISKCTKVENLHIVRPKECSNYGLVCVAEQCKLLRKLHVEGSRNDRIGDEGLVAIAKHCPNLQELVLVGVNATHFSLAAIASNCMKLQRLALCASGTIGDAEIVCIAMKCMALRRLCIKACPISDLGIEALAWGCPSLVKIKVRKCRGVSNEASEWLRERRKGSVVIDVDAYEIDGGLESSTSDGGVHENGILFPRVVGQVNGPDASTSRYGGLALLRSKLGLFTGRNLVTCTLRRWSNSDDSLNGNL